MISTLRIHPFHIFCKHQRIFFVSTDHIIVKRDQQIRSDHGSEPASFAAVHISHNPAGMTFQVPPVDRNHCRIQTVLLFQIADQLLCDNRISRMKQPVISQPENVPQRSTCAFFVVLVFLMRRRHTPYGKSFPEVWME